MTLAMVHCMHQWKRKRISSGFFSRQEHNWTRESMPEGSCQLPCGSNTLGVDVNHLSKDLICSLTAFKAHLYKLQTLLIVICVLSIYMANISVHCAIVFLLHCSRTSCTPTIIALVDKINTKPHPSSHLHSRISTKKKGCIGFQVHANIMFVAGTTHLQPFSQQLVCSCSCGQTLVSHKICK